MANLKIITKPVDITAYTDKSRNIIGINEWAKSSGFVRIVMAILGWFTVPFEVFFRRDFGQRWLTPLNFFVGLVPLIAAAIVEMSFDPFSLKQRFAWLSPVNPFGGGHYIISGIIHIYNIDSIMIPLIALYLLMGLYHLFKIMWRNRAGIPLHSLDDGTSRLRWISFVLMWVLNIVATPFLFIYWLLIPYRQRKGKRFPVLIINKDAFASVFAEPALVFFFAFGIYGVVHLWLFISGVAMLVYAQMKETIRRHKILDFQDSRIESQLMRDLKKSLMEKEQAKKSKPTGKVKQDKLTKPLCDYPSLSVIIEETNKERIASPSVQP